MTSASQYANITLLTGVRFDTLKLDRAIIAELENSPITQTLVRDLVQICRAYGMACVAEGVGDRGQVRTLLEMGCTCGQGFYYDRPLPPAAFSQKYLRKSASPGGENPQDKEAMRMRKPEEMQAAAGGASPQTPMVIGIGASAGGLEALQQFFGCMPPNSGLSFVVVQHLSPDYKSLMADILGKHTEMAVCPGGKPHGH